MPGNDAMTVSKDREYWNTVSLVKRTGHKDTLSVSPKESILLKLNQRPMTVRELFDKMSADSFVESGDGDAIDFGIGYRTLYYHLEQLEDANLVEKLSSSPYAIFGLTDLGRSIAEDEIDA